MPQTSADIVERAEQLALSLTSGPTPVGRNVLLGIASDFLTDPKPDQEQLRRTVELIAKGSGGHLKRGGGYGDQIRIAAQEISRVLDERLSNPELKSLLGWTARLLLVRRERRSEGTPASRQDRGMVSGNVRKQPSLPKAAPRDSFRGSVNKRALSALELLKQKLDAKKEEG